VYRLLDTIVRGVQVGSVYGLVALGLSVVFSATGIFNFAHGDMVMVGALLGLKLWHRDSHSLLLTVVVVMAVAGVLGGATEVVAVHGTRRSSENSVTWVISTLAVSIIVEAGARTYLRGGAFPSYLHMRSFSIGKLLIVPQRAVLFPIALVVTTVMWLWFTRTLWGRAFTAMAADREGARMRGIPVGRFAVLAFVLGAALAGFAGIAAGPITQASVAAAVPSTLQGFVAATIGGMLRPWGPLVGGLFLGLLIQFTTVYWNAAFNNVVELSLLLLILLVRPEGILGRRVRAV